MRKRVSISIFLLTALWIGAAHSALVGEPQKTVLPNGLTVIIQENHASPVVTLQAFVYAGSVYEGEHLGAGLSHFLEHLVAGGTTARRTEAEQQEISESIGNYSNASTGNEYTNYYITTASDYFDTALDLIADYMTGATIPEADFLREQGVILNEMRMRDDEPQVVLYETLDATMFSAHPMKYRIIGTPDKFTAVTRDELTSYYLDRYAPNNLVFVVVGDVEAGEVLSKIEQTFATFTRQGGPLPALAEEPPQTQPRILRKEADVAVEYLAVGFRSIPLTNPDMYPLDVLAQILGGGETSRLWRSLVEEKRLMDTVSAYDYTPGVDAGTFAITGTLSPENHDAAIEAIRGEIELVKQEPVTEAELDRAKAQVSANYISQLQTVDGQAQTLGSDELLTGNMMFSKEYVDNIRAVKAEEVQAVAKNYLDLDAVSIVALVPRGGGAEEQASQAPSHVASRETKDDITKVTFDNGLRLLVKSNPATPSVAATAMILGGRLFETEDTAGLFSVLGDMLTRGAASRTYEQITTEVEDAGASLSGFSGNNSYGVDLWCLKEDFPRLSGLFADVLLNPAFPEGELTKVRENTEAAIARRGDDWTQFANDYMRAALFGEHPYGLPALGTEETVEAITAESLRNTHALFARPEDTVISVFGDVDVDNVIAQVDALFGGWSPQESPQPEIPPLSPMSSEVVREYEKPGQAQGIVYMGYRGQKALGSDLPAMDVLDGVLSGIYLPGGRLHNRLRGLQLVYVVHAFPVTGIEPGYFGIYAASEPGDVDEIRRIIDEELQRVVDEPVGPEEMARGKAIAISSFAIQHQSNADQGQTATMWELYGRGYDYPSGYTERIEAVTPERVQQVAREILNKDHRAVIVVLPEEES